MTSDKRPVVDEPPIIIETEPFPYRLLQYNATSSLHLGVGSIGKYPVRRAPDIPTITALTPNVVNKYDPKQLIVIDGTNFDSWTTITVEGIPHEAAFVNEGRLRFEFFPDNPAGIRTVEVANDHGTASIILTVT